MVPELITSAQNPKIKRLLALQKDSSLRRECGLFVVEGRRELQHCLDSGFEIDSLFVCPEIAGAADIGDALSRIFALRAHPSQPGGWAPPSNASEGGHGSGREVPSSFAPAEDSACARVQIDTPLREKKAENSLNGAPECTFEPTPVTQAKVFEVSEAVYEKIAYRGGTEGVIAEVKVRNRKLDDLNLPENPLIVVLEAVEKPGNLGAVLRSADAAGADAVLICDPLTDLYNPNLIRASIGAIFTVPCIACSSEEAISFLKQHGISILTAQLQDSSLYYDTDMRGGTAIVMGTESTGLSQQWRAAATAHIRIPMLGHLDSLNVSVSAAILLFEAVRQRQS